MFEVKEDDEKDRGYKQRTSEQLITFTKQHILGADSLLTVILEPWSLLMRVMCSLNPGPWPILWLLPSVTNRQAWIISCCRGNNRLPHSTQPYIRSNSHLFHASLLCKNLCFISFYFCFLPYLVSCLLCLLLVFHFTFHLLPHSYL